MAEYLENIWNSRYFWTHLAMADLRSKWRRSYFGVLWSIIQPLQALDHTDSGRFRQDLQDRIIVTYAPYILSGVIVWDYISSTAVGGALAFVQADAYIKQSRHPLAIYTLRTALANLMVLAMASLSLIGWALIVLPQNFGLCWVAALLIIPVVGAICWPMATCLAYIGTRFRDLPHALRSDPAGDVVRIAGLYRCPDFSRRRPACPRRLQPDLSYSADCPRPRFCRVNGPPRRTSSGVQRHSP